MSGGEIVLIMLFVLIFFGADKIPEIARGLGRGMREFKKAADEIKAEITNDTQEIRNELSGLRTELTKNTSELKHEVDDIKTDLQHNVTELRQEVDHAVRQEKEYDPSYDVYDELKEDKDKLAQPVAKPEPRHDKENPDQGAFI